MLGIITKKHKIRVFYQLLSCIFVHPNDHPYLGETYLTDLGYFGYKMVFTSSSVKACSIIFFTSIFGVSRIILLYASMIRCFANSSTVIPAN